MGGAEGQEARRVGVSIVLLESFPTIEFCSNVGRFPNRDSQIMAVAFAPIFGSSFIRHPFSLPRFNVSAMAYLGIRGSHCSAVRHGATCEGYRADNLHPDASLWISGSIGALCDGSCRVRAPVNWRRFPSRSQNDSAPSIGRFRAHFDQVILRSTLATSGTNHIVWPERGSFPSST